MVCEAGCESEFVVKKADTQCMDTSRCRRDVEDCLCRKWLDDGIQELEM